MTIKEKLALFDHPKEGLAIEGKGWALTFNGDEWLFGPPDEEPSVPSKIVLAVIRDAVAGGAVEVTES